MTSPARAAAAEQFIVHATSDWSRQQLEWSGVAAAKKVVGRFQPLTWVHEQSTYSAVHRWRYALVEETAGFSFLWDEGGHLGACGNWCLGPQIEAVFNRGEALAEAIQQAQRTNYVF